MIVTLVGAGPGDSGLLTLKGLQRLQNADVVLYDRYIGEEILSIIPAAAEKIDVGKKAGRHPVPQEEINSLLLEKARQGLRVVRLKGGDPFVFGRGGEELDFLVDNGIPFEVVPGVTSAIAGPAYAGIPVTHRKHASSLHIISGHPRKDAIPAANYDALVRAGGTLVFLMGVAAVGDICRGCVDAGMDVNMPAAIIENATVGSQRVFSGTVQTLPAIARENNVNSPSVIVIGNVCRLSGRFGWFKPEVRRVPGRRVIVVRGRPGSSDLSDMLRELGFQAVDMQCFAIVPLTGPGCELEKAIGKINGYAWLLFTSSIGVNVFFDYFIANGFDIRTLANLKVGCVGSETGKELARRGIAADYRPPEYNGAALARGLVPLVKNGEKLLILRAKNGAEGVTRILADAGIAFDDVPLYEKVQDSAKTGAAARIIAENRADFAVFTSSSAVESFAAAAEAAAAAAGTDISAIKAVCIGERTAAAAKSYGMEVHVSAEATIKSIVEKIKELA